MAQRNEAWKIPFEQANVQYEKGNYESALKLYKKSLVLISEQDSSGIINVETRVGDSYRKLGLLDSALIRYNRVIKLAVAGGERYEVQLLDAKYNRAFVYSRQYLPLKAIEEFRSLFPLVEAKYGRSSSDYAYLHLNLGIDYYKTGDYYLSNKEFINALEIFREVSEPDSEDFNRVYNNLGGNYRKLGDYKKALEYAEQALEIKLLHYDKSHPSVAKYHMNIGKVLSDMGRKVDALPYLFEALEVYKVHYDDRHPSVAGMKGEIGNVYADLGQFDLAEKWYLESLDIDTFYMKPDHPYFLAGLANMAHIYLDQGKVREARKQHEQALDLLSRRSFVPPDKKAEMLWLMSDINMADGQPKLAIDNLYQALNLLSDNKEANSTSLPDCEDVLFARMYLDIGISLLECIDTLALDDLEGNWEERGLDLSENLICVLYRLRQGYHSDESRRVINSEIAPIYRYGVEFAHQLYNKTNSESYLIRAFQLAEASKADILKNNVNQGLALKMANVPQGMLDSLDDLSQRLGQLKSELKDTENEEKPIRRADLEHEVFKVNEDYEDLQRIIENKYPEYYSLRFTPSKIDVDALRDRVDLRNCLLVSYYLGSEKIYIYYVDGHGISTEVIEHGNELQEHIDVWRNFMNPDQIIKDQNGREGLKDVSVKLYDLLLKGAMQRFEKASYSHMVIVPSGNLFYLSFEALHPTPSNDGNVLEFVIEKAPIYYTTSAQLWSENLEQSRSYEVMYKGFAPDYQGEEGSERSAFSKLFWNIREVESMARMLSGVSFTGVQASEANFKSESEGAEYLHFAMHGIVNEELPMNSGLQFANSKMDNEDGFLNLYEVFETRLDARTVIMNACHSGYGKYSEGEGLISMANAFQYAGAENVIMNLWMADDQSTSKIMHSFCNFILEGDADMMALRKAKLKYLKEADPLRRHPYFWSGLVFQGNESKVFSPSKWRYVIVAIVSFIIVFGSIIYWRRTSRRS